MTPNSAKPGDPTVNLRRREYLGQLLPPDFSEVGGIATINRPRIERLEIVVGEAVLVHRCEERPKGRPGPWLARG